MRFYLYESSKPNLIVLLVLALVALWIPRISIQWTSTHEIDFIGAKEKHVPYVKSIREITIGRFCFEFLHRKPKACSCLLFFNHDSINLCLYDLGRRYAMTLSSSSIPDVILWCGNKIYNWTYACLTFSLKKYTN